MTDPFGEQRRGVFHFDDLLTRLSKIKSRIEDERAAKERIDEAYLQNDRSTTLEKLGVSGTSLGSASMASAKLPRSKVYPEMDLPDEFFDLNPDDDEPETEPLTNSSSTTSTSGASPEKPLAAASSASDVVVPDVGVDAESVANHVTSGPVASADAEASAYSPKGSKPTQATASNASASSSSTADSDGAAGSVRRSERLKKSTKTAKA